MGSTAAGCCALTVIAVVLLAPAVLQVWGTVAKDDWSGSECPQDDNTGNGTAECASALPDVSQVAMNLEIASSVMVVFTVISCVGSLCIDVDEHASMGCIIMLGVLSYPVSGILSIAGCSLFASKLAVKHYGRAFFFCLSAGIITEVFTFIACCCACIAVRDDSDEYQGTNEPSSTVVDTGYGYPAGGVLPSSGQSGTVMSYEQAHVSRGSVSYTMQVIKVFSLHRYTDN